MLCTARHVSVGDSDQLRQEPGASVGAAVSGDCALDREWRR